MMKRLFLLAIALLFGFYLLKSWGLPALAAWLGEAWASRLGKAFLGAAFAVIALTIYRKQNEKK